MQGIEGKKAAVFVTMASSGGSRALNYMEESIKKRGGLITSSIYLSRNDIIDESVLKSSIEKFILQLTSN